ncbi:phosphate acyltransferase PlsX [Varunaivibrio sulfuroxidans]|uniref:Phosphate acyltransferase n=1 Tax=Varunaivibrio sulfuroxidans TaxID=1773489 RepID=A0A4R3J5R8_9PROT|nr:phosphate acyltransferase PlsX [Varunaivibrio sulfuroxidans]TCS61239.1 phosphate:acyl-[acyl carrier protein] acyltransferase [Varunaivibrio sulfuroxidans]WES31140.1 phosphate acyltransferase PlsX [Varunaivibrio sulfuroxidans]
MTERVILSVDAMGGDDAPFVVIEGMDLALKRMPDLGFLLFGDESKILPLLGRFPRVKALTECRHTPDAVSNDEKAGAALRSGRNSSMRLAINAVASGESSGVVSAGNTGALMAMAKFVLKTLPGIDRPAIATYFPTLRNECVMLDLGANILCDADNLVQFAVMGEVFARHVLKLNQPTIGILNVGSEDLKGHDSVKQAAAILSDTNLPIRFYGFVEGDDIGAGTVDVIVTDGFTGNVALKTAEGTARLFSTSLRAAFKSSLLGKIGALVAMPALNKFRDRFDPRRYNGAMFLGLNGVCVKSHGGTDAFGFSCALQVAHKLIKDQLNEGIKADFARLNVEPSSLDPASQEE